MADTARQRDHGGDAAAGHQHGEHDAHRLRPVGKGRQQHRVEDQRQVGDGQQAVGLEEQAVGEALGERDHDQHHRRVEGPLAHRFREATLGAEEDLDRVGERRLRPPLGLHQPAPAHRPLRALRPQPVDHREHQAGDAQPLVQAVGLVQPVEQRLHPHRAQRQDHAHAHDADADHAGVVDRHRAQGKVFIAVGQQRIGHPPQQAEQQQQPSVRKPDVVHRLLHSLEIPRPLRCIGCARHRTDCFDCAPAAAGPPCRSANESAAVPPATPGGSRFSSS